MRSGGVSPPRGGEHEQETRLDLPHPPAGIDGKDGEDGEDGEDETRGQADASGVRAVRTGLDVHKATVVACVLSTQADGSVREQGRKVSTMTADLAALRAWLREQDVECVARECVARESTGVFWWPVVNLWWPVVNLLEEQGHQVVLVNAQHMKAIPGHKTDSADRRWLRPGGRTGGRRPG